MKKSIFTLFLLHIVLLGFAQDSLTNELSYEVNAVYTPLTVTAEELNEAQTLSDLNRYYRPSWVRTYTSVEVLTSYNGKIKKATGKDNIITQEQKDIMKMADNGSDVFVNIQYIPENNLKENEPKEFNFSFKIAPAYEAEYIGGQENLKEHLKKSVIDKIPDGIFKDYALAAIKFTINEEGQIIDANIFETSNDEKVDQILLETISNMPCWKPAEYTNGTKVKQEFVFTVGNHKSCIINTLNIRQDLTKRE